MKNLGIAYSVKRKWKSKPEEMFKKEAASEVALKRQSIADAIMAKRAPAVEPEEEFLEDDATTEQELMADDLEPVEQEPADRAAMISGILASIRSKHA